MRTVLLGPQRDERTISSVAREYFLEGPVATVTAGWQEWELDDEALDHDLGGRSRNLELYRRAETVFDSDPELRTGHGDLQRQVRLLRRAYQARVERAYEAWRAVDRLEGSDGVLAPEREAAFEAIRDIDEHHADRVGELRAEYDRTFKPQQRPSIAKQRQEVRRLLADCVALVMEGGHVPVLLNRMRLFGVSDLLAEHASEDLTVVACAGGAMVISPRVVFFHDYAPQGPARPEVAERGLGLVQGVVALPDAARRLDLEDDDRVSRLARRFAPDSCLTLDGGSHAEWDGTTWGPVRAGRLTLNGQVESWNTPS